MTIRRFAVFVVVVLAVSLFVVGSAGADPEKDREVFRARVKEAVVAGGSWAQVAVLNRELGSLPVLLEVVEEFGGVPTMFERLHAGASPCSALGVDGACYLVVFRTEPRLLPCSWPDLGGSLAKPSGGSIEVVVRIATEPGGEVSP